MSRFFCGSNGNFNAILLFFQMAVLLSGASFCQFLGSGKNCEINSQRIFGSQCDY